MLKNKYGNFLLPKNRSLHSYSHFCKSLQSRKNTFLNFCCKLIGNGNNTKVWLEPWIPGLRNFKRVPKCDNVIIDVELKIPDLT